MDRSAQKRRPWNGEEYDKLSVLLRYSVPPVISSRSLRPLQRSDGVKGLSAYCAYFCSASIHAGTGAGKPGAGPKMICLVSSGVP